MSEQEARVALFSLRNVYSERHFTSGLFEFEDNVCKLDTVDLIAPWRTDWFVPGNRTSVFLGNKLRWPTSLGIASSDLHKDYDLFVAVCHHPDDVLKVTAVRGWKQRARETICLLVELWPHDIALYNGSMEMLKEFDHVVLNNSTSVELLSHRLGRECSYMPPAVDVELFCPLPDPPIRIVDFYSIGRRSPTTHSALMDLARQRDFFYIYDSLSGYDVFNSKDHRFLYANIAGRSRYFLVNPGKIDMAPQAGYPSEFGPRFFEGAAAGCVLVGEPSTNDAFRTIFTWPDAVVNLKYGSANIAEVLAEINDDADRELQIRRNNMKHMLLAHDWVHRWEHLLEMTDLSPTAEVAERKRLLEQRAQGL